MKFCVYLRDKVNYNVNICLYGFSGLHDCISWLTANYAAKLYLTQYPEFVILKEKSKYLQTYNVYTITDNGIKLRCHYKNM